MLKPVFQLLVDIATVRLLYEPYTLFLVFAELSSVDSASGILQNTDIVEVLIGKVSNVDIFHALIL
jgi:hypothetical protein